MNINRINSQKGIAQFLVIAVMAFLALGIPTATKLVQQNQENRSKATSETKTELSNLNSGPNKPQIIDGACGSVKYGDLTENTAKDKPELLCKSGKVAEFIGVAPNCISDPNCPSAYYSWKCLGSNGGKSVKCTVKQNITPTSRPTLVPTRHPQLPATSIRISPLGLSLKVGQNRNLTYVLSPGSSTDTVKWSTSAEGMVRIQKITTKCSDSPNAKCIDAPGINNLLVTGLKAGTVKIKLTTSSGKTAQATVVVQK